MVIRMQTANMRQWKLVILTASALCLGACKDNGLLSLTGNAMRPPEIRSFNAALADEYRVLADFARESAQTNAQNPKTAPLDEDRAIIFYGKSESAAQGQNVNPESLNDYAVPTYAREDLQQARAQLVAALEKVNVPENGPLLAMAQVQFDCWLAYQPQQQDSYVGCREAFHQAMSNVDFTKTANKSGDTKPAVLIAAAGPRTIHFLNDTMTLDQDAHDAIALLAEQALAQQGAGIMLTGYSKIPAHIEDTSNNAVRRMIAVRNALYQNGVDPDQVQTEFVKGGDPQDVDVAVLPPPQNNS